MKIALLYEHPTWSSELVARMFERGLDVTALDVGELHQSAPDLGGPHDLWINRVNAMPSAGRPKSVVATTAHLLLSLEMRGQRVVNGFRSHALGGSKIAQAALFGHLGLATPASISIHRQADALQAADTLGYPVLTKPNVGGSGSGIARYDHQADLEIAVNAEAIDLGIDGTGLVQKIVESADGLVYRIEMLGIELFYATRQPIRAGAFNYCAADGCTVGGPTQAIDVFVPDQQLVAHAAAVMLASATDVGGVEFIVDATTGQPCFFDFNPYSNFVTGQEGALGFDPVDRYLDSVLERVASST